MRLAGRWLLGALLGWVTGTAPVLGQADPDRSPATFSNPLPVEANGTSVDSCADPSVIEELGQDAGWVMYCTTDPLSGEDRDATGDLRFRLLPMFQSDDLVGWTYRGDAFDRDAETDTPAPPAWAAPSALLWAPEAEVIGDRYYLLFGVTDVIEQAGGEPGCATDGAIGYAVSDSPFGPWEPSSEPLVEPRRSAPGCDFLWTYDPEVIATPDGRHFLYYGSYHGGIEVRELAVAPDGVLNADPATARPVAIPNRYEGAEVIHHDDAYWLFVSASNCCNGPQTGYSVFVGRATSPTGPFLDRDGASLLDARVGGTPVLTQNGNGWVGPGHNTVLQDRAGQWWTLYHAIEEADPYFAGEVGFTRRPVLLDRLDWVEGWPVVIGGPSTEPRPAPVVQAGQAGAKEAQVDRAGGPPGGARIAGVLDEFNGPALASGWAWVRESPEEEIGLEGGSLGLGTTDTDLYGDRDDAPLLLREAPAGDYVLETRVALDVPADGCCHNYVQAGLVVRGDDDNYLKLVVVSIWETRQTEFAREMAPVPEGFPHYGSSVAGPPGGEWTWLRLAVSRIGEGESYTAYTSRDGERWVQGSTWTHDLGPEAQIGLASMGGPGDFMARFDYLRVLDVDG
ncbi:family 43 glycosylhydrolase [Rubellimicrobium roseum]|nr:family 43 glycosylhydrolase [Rubellimicrobium roseum]